MTDKDARTACPPIIGIRRQIRANSRLAYRVVAVKATDPGAGKSSLRDRRDGSMSIVLGTAFG